MTPAERSLATVLFTDIVGSTERASQLGDRQWGELKTRHHAAVRDELRRWGGHEVNESGDGFMALFDNPVPAILCAAAIRDEVRSMGLEVRCGVHMGGVERALDGSVGGIAVHIGARVAALASPGEVLVSGTVRDLESGSDFEFEDRGRHALKGVPGEWRLYAVTNVPEGAVPPVPRALRPTRVRWLWGGRAIAAALVAIALAGFFLIPRGSGPPSGSTEALAAGADPGIAVAPFKVNDPELNFLREGMVDLLSTTLDGVGGLRAISSRTVFARWGERVEGNASPDLATTLAVAGETGARYAVVGSAVGIGSEVRLTGDVFEIESQKRLGSARVQGPMEDVWTLVDRFTIEIIKAILEGEEGTPKIRGLAAVTTDSLEALKAYLEGQQLYRQADFAAAANSYAHAVEIDSTFALADLELDRMCGWIMGEFEACNGAGGSVVRFAHRLPEREAAAVGIRFESMEELFEHLRANVRRYPDDPMAWYALGDKYFHLGRQMLVDASPDSSFQALVRSVEVAPGAAPLEGYLHLLNLAWGTADSSQIERWLDAAGPYAPGNDILRAQRLALALAFGDSAAATRARLEIRALDFESAETVATSLGHPRFLPLQTELYEELLARDDIGDRGWYIEPFTVVGLIDGGRLRSALAHLNGPLRPGPLRPGPRASNAYELHRAGMTLPADGVRKWLSVDEGETCFQCFFYAGAYAADQGNWSDHRRAVEELRRLGRLEQVPERFGAQAGGGTADPRYYRDAARALEGYALWKQGKTREGELILEAQQRRIVGGSFEANFVNWTIRRWLGEIAVESSRWADAARYFESLRGRDPHAELLYGLLIGAGLHQARRAREGARVVRARAAGVAAGRS